MNPKSRDKQFLLAIGSAMEVLPMGNYSEYLPKGTAAQRIGSSWYRVSKYIKKASINYEEVNTYYAQS